jgi:hypothetical protein
MWSDGSKSGADGDGPEFAALLRAHANRELTAEERARLDVLAAAGPERWQEVDDVTLVHGLFDAEQELRSEILRPVESREEADPVYQGLLRRAARAEADLRRQSLPQAAPGPLLQAPRAQRWLRIAAAAAVLLGLVTWYVLRGAGGAPELIPGSPGRETLGGQRVVVVQPALTVAEPAIAWFAIPGAASYDVELIGRVQDVDRVLFQQRSIPAHVLRCDFPRAQLPELAQASDLRVRITARAGDGVALASSGDLPVSLR